MEEVLPPQTAEGSGFELTRVRQFTIFLENRVGRLQSLLLTLEERAEKIAALCIEESADAALVRLICATPETAKQCLVDGGFSFNESEVLAVELPRKTRQPWVALGSALLAAEINIHYVYPFLLRPRGPTVALYVDDATLAAQLLIKKGFRLVAESELH